MGRDKWMAIKLTEQAGDTPILVLLGSLHTLKTVNWDLSVTKVSPYVSEILIPMVIVSIHNLKVGV